ncbi:MAG: hypothetical protein IJB70_01850 [Clostridia bacterium]|nr:hypothetical protein [Clostridia bacterium]MBQ6864720.1 hypothetical protein [Clostridia bacterium]
MDSIQSHGKYKFFTNILHFYLCNYQRNQYSTPNDRSKKPRRKNVRFFSGSERAIVANCSNYHKYKTSNSINYRVGTNNVRDYSPTFSFFCK